MELEDRVVTLEHEIKILKNEIQQTLLDLREFLLTTTYPELNGEETSDNMDALVRDEEESVSRLGITPSKEEGGSGGRSRRSDTEAGTVSLGTRRPPSLTALMAWAGESVQRIGKERTLQALKAWASSGHLAKETEKLLAQLIAMSEDEEPTEKVRVQDILQVLMALGELLGEDMTLADALSHVNR